MVEVIGFKNTFAVQPQVEEEQDSHSSLASAADCDGLRTIEESSEFAIDPLNAAETTIVSQADWNDVNPLGISGDLVVDVVDTSSMDGTGRVLRDFAHAFSVSDSQWLSKKPGADVCVARSMYNSDGLSQFRSDRGSLLHGTHCNSRRGSRRSSWVRGSIHCNSRRDSRGSGGPRRRVLRKTVTWGPSCTRSISNDDESTQSLKLRRRLPSESETDFPNRQPKEKQNEQTLEVSTEKETCSDRCSSSSSCRSMGFDATDLRKKSQEHVGVRATLEQAAFTRLCGRCLYQSVDSVAPLFPSRELHRQLARHLAENVKPMRQDMADSQLPSAMPHWRSDYGEIRLPPLPPASELTRRPHRKLKMLSGFEAFTLQAQILQQRIKMPAMRENVESLDLDANKRVAQLREQLQAAGLRMVICKSIKDRTLEEEQAIVNFLKKRPFFKCLADSTLKEIGRKLQVRRYEEKEVVFQQDCAAKHVFILLRGACKFQETDLPFTTREPTRGSLKQARDSVRDATLDELEKDWRGAKGLGLNPHVGNDIHDSHVLGLWDIVVPFSSPPQAQKQRLYTKTAIAASTVESFLLNSDVLVNLIEAEAIRERVKVLQATFPLTKGKTAAELISPSRVERKGRRITLHSLFKISEVRGKTTLWMQGDLPSAEDAQVILILGGVVQIKKRGLVIDTVGEGVLIGEEALRSEPYQYTACIHSDSARILFLSASDFLVQYGRITMAQQSGNDKQPNDIGTSLFYGSKAPSGISTPAKNVSVFQLQKVVSTFKNKALSKEKSSITIGSEQDLAQTIATMRSTRSTIVAASSSLDDANVGQLTRQRLSHSARKSICAAPYSMLYKSLKEVKEDRELLKETEWKSLLPKELPQRRAPPDVSEKHYDEDLSEVGPPRRFKRRSDVNRDKGARRSLKPTVGREQRMLDRVFGGASAVDGITNAMAIAASSVGLGDFSRSRAHEHQNSSQRARPRALL